MEGSGQCGPFRGTVSKVPRQTSASEFADTLTRRELILVGQNATSMPIDKIPSITAQAIKEIAIVKIPIRKYSLPVPCREGIALVQGGSGSFTLNWPLTEAVLDHTMC
jgi:hypothetical protein